VQSDWSQYEIDLIVADYFQMLTLEIKGLSYNKSERRKALQQLLNNRSEGSIEFKHQNISAVLVKHGLPFIAGYKPRFNLQHALEVSVEKYYLFQKPLFESLFEQFSTSVPSPIVSEAVDFSKFEDSPPPLAQQVEESPEVYLSKRISKINYLEQEQRNSHLGALGEQLIIEFEKWRLISAGKAYLSGRIELISQEQGDGAGYDILSRNTDGSDRFIEVKTTKLSKFTPIYVSRNELSFSKANPSNYFLYRVFQYGSTPKLFTKNGPLDAACHLEPLQYIGRF
jgi:hypothetical protein